MDPNEALKEFLSNYDKSEQIQSNQEAFFDSQIKTLSLVLSNKISAHSSGTILDIGCGDGILLRRLSDIEDFQKNASWSYIGTDYPEKHENIVRLAFELSIHRRVDVLSLENLYTSWIAPDLAHRPIIVIIRNIFHELDIYNTSRLIHILVKKLTDNDSLLIQDIHVFPKAERGHACWIPPIFVSLLKSCGFDCNYTQEVTPKGNRWFSIHSNPSQTPSLSFTDVKKNVIRERFNQYEQWSSMDFIVDEDIKMRHPKVALLDFDLQLAALQKQLIDAGSEKVSLPTSSEESDITNSIFQMHLDSFDPTTTTIVNIDRPPHFRNRAKSQDALEAFLLSESSVVQIQGGPFMGKSVLVSEVLNRRSHDRKVVMIDINYTSTVWNLIEQYLAGLDCIFPYQLASSFKSTQFANIAEPLNRLVDRDSRHSIIVFDHFERLLDPNNVVQDTEIQQFLVMLVAAEAGKVIITTRRSPVLSFLPEEVSVNLAQPPVGRFPQGHHVENVLDDFINRSKLGIDSYPPDLLEAIDRVPYLAVLAATIINKEGLSTLLQPEFIELVQKRLRDELLRRVITDISRPVIELMSFIRIPIPRSMLEAIAGVSSVNEAEELGLLYHIFNRRRSDLMTCIMVLRNYPLGNDDTFEADPSPKGQLNLVDKKHRLISDWYERLYREDSDPRWLREMYYHILASGDSNLIKQFGSIYRGEIFLAGDYWFRTRREYKQALEAYEAAIALGLVTYTSEMRYASCLMRVGRTPEGKQVYNKLFDQYPNARGIRTSYIDSLLYLRGFQDALDALIEFKFETNDDRWIAHQYGRAYFGLFNYQGAVNSFEIAVSISHEAIDYYNLARAYYRLGDQYNVGRVLNAGLKAHSDNRNLRLSYAAHLIQLGNDDDLDEAEEILNDLHKFFPNQGFVLQQLCKLLCQKSRVDEAIEIVNKTGYNIYPEGYKLPITVELLIGQHEWDKALSALSVIPDNDEHLVGIKKKVYLRWALSEADEDKRRGIASDGLKVSIHSDLSTNVPIMVTSAHLAVVADDFDSLNSIIKMLRTINPNVASAIESEDVNYFYWEDDSFAKP